MTFFETWFSRKLMTTKKMFTNCRPSLIFLQPKSNKYTGKEYYPYSCGFDLFQYKDTFIARFHILLTEYNLETKDELTVSDTIEVRMPGISKPRQAIANRLLQLAVKELMKKYKPLGYKESLAGYLYVAENEQDKYTLELEDTYEKFNKFRSIRYGG